MAAKTSWMSSSSKEKFQHLQLDVSKESLSLLSILRAFDGPVNEERAWAILYQSAKTALQCFNSANNNNNNSDYVKCCVVGETSQLWIHRDGHVHPHSFQLNPIEAEGRTVADCQTKLVSGLGWALFEALDYGCKRDEQNVLSPDLDQMIDLMTSADGGESHSAEDEGIERDSGEVDDPSSGAAMLMTSLLHVMDRCRMQISSTASSGQADAHFRAVCRALVAETLEFSDFLVKVSSAPENWRELRSKPELHCPELTGLHLADWAKLWVQVIRQLRNGVKLKACVVGESARKPIEYELTPYEMMMDDIRSRRYKLRQVMVDGVIPARVKKDAHAVILEFIRSRPPLRKASERTLRPPARRVSTPVELLMESIRQHDSKELRPTRSLMVDRTERTTTTLPMSTTKRKLLKADQFNPDLDDDDDDLEEVPPASPPRRHDYDQFSCSSELSTPLNSRNRAEREEASRRHSITVIPGMSRTTNSSAPFIKSQSHNSHLSSYSHQPVDPRIRLIPSQLSESGSLPCSGPSSSASSVSSASLPSPPGSPMRDHLQENFIRSEDFQDNIQGKLVTLEELVHMRNVLTAASLENLPQESSIKDDVSNGKVCFVCRKTRFGLWTWWRSCKLCRRTICGKCCTKVRIPSENFDSVAVSELGCFDQQSSSSLLSSLKLPNFRISSPGTTESTPSSPVFTRRDSGRRQTQCHQTLSRHQSLSANNTPVSRVSAAADNRKTSSGSDVHVCRDCQSLIEHIAYSPVHTLHREHAPLATTAAAGDHISLP